MENFESMLSSDIIEFVCKLADYTLAYKYKDIIKEEDLVEEIEPDIIAYKPEYQKEFDKFYDYYYNELSNHVRKFTFQSLLAKHMENFKYVPVDITGFAHRFAHAVLVYKYGEEDLWERTESTMRYKPKYQEEFNTLYNYFYNELDSYTRVLFPDF